MLGSNWRKGLAVGLAALAALVLAIFSYVQYRAAEAEQIDIALQANEQAQIQDDQARREIERGCQNLPGPGERIDCEQQAHQEPDKAKREIRDLEAQQTMALWTRYMGLAAIIGTTVGIIGVGLIFFTFKETRRTAEIADRNHRAFALFESAVLVIEFAKPPSFFVEDGKMHMRFRLKCTNAGRTSAFVTAVGVEGAGPTYYSFICKADDAHTFGKDHKVIVDGKDTLRGYVQYSSHVETANRRRFHIALTLGERPSTCRATMHTGGVLRKGDQNYEEPFSQHGTPSK
jgi:hypothetical protein